MALSTSTNGSFNGQVNTQSPQTSAPAAAGSPPAAPGKNVQSGTANSLLNGAVGGSQGIPLNNTALPVVSLDTSTQTATVQPSPPVKSQHPNAVLLGVVAVLVVSAAVIFWLTKQSAKNTTDY